MKVEIKYEPNEIGPFVKTIQNEADNNRNAFGFLPKRAYQELADQRKVLVAIDPTTSSYAGHLIFGGVHPHGRVFQTHVSNDYRQRGVGRQLMNALVRRAEAEHYLSLRADVAEDLTVANTFYQQMGFRQVRLKSGRGRRNRSIVIRIRELHTPSLLDLLSPPTTKTDLRLHASGRTRSPRYVIDLNVVYDIIKKRARQEDARRVIRAGLDNTIRLAVTDEFIRELAKTSYDSKLDPVLELATALPQVLAPPKEVLSELTRKLAPVIFPDRAREGRLTSQDESDLIHLTTAIHHDAAGFITAEKAILRAAPELRRLFSLDVLSPADFRDPTAPSAPEYSLESVSNALTVSVGGLRNGDQAEVERFLERMVVPHDVISSIISVGISTAPKKRIVAFSSGVVGFASWDTVWVRGLAREIFVCVDEDDLAAESVLDHFLERAIRDACALGPAVLRFEPLTGHTRTREVALLHGFRPINPRLSHGPMHKACLGAVATTSDWDALRQHAQNNLRIILPRSMPAYTSVTQPIRIETEHEHGRAFDVELSELEELLSPAIFAMPGREGVIVPIRPNYAEALFRGTMQPNLLGSPPAALLRERIYISDRRTLTNIREGALMIFYESGKAGGRSAATAVARVRRSYAADKGSAIRDAVRRGVLSEADIDGIGINDSVALTEFDNVMLFKRPITLTQLRRLGCADRANFVTARALSPNQVATILREGQPICLMQ